MGVIVAGGLALVCPALAQAAPANGAPGAIPEISGMTVSEVVEGFRRWQVPVLLVAAALVLALMFAGGLLRPGGLAKAGGRDVTPMPWILWLFAALITFLALQSAAGIVQASPWLAADEGPEMRRDAIIQILAYACGSVAGLGMLYIMAKSCPEGGMRLSILDAPVGLGLFVLAYPIVALAGVAAVLIYGAFTEGATPPEVAHATLERIASSDDPWRWGLVGAAVIGAPVVEELMYRVFLQSALLRLFKSPWLAIVTASLVFAVAHRAGPVPVPWHALIPIFVLGICMGVAYERTRRVGVPIIMHVCFNALNIALVLAITTEA